MVNVKKKARILCVISLIAGPVKIYRSKSFPRKMRNKNVPRSEVKRFCFRLLTSEVYLTAELPEQIY